ncbi:MAG: hypothetical protein HYY24_16450 [Verrucomicrobia bacterium]|nr:hypothetical protein [Verrucomicrobiota bacterium]
MRPTTISVLTAFFLWSGPPLASVLAADAPATFKVSEFTFTRPAAWEWVETAGVMRKAQLKVTDAKTKETGEVIFFFFGAGQGGGVLANVDRWLGMFQEPRDELNAKTDKATVGTRTVTYVEAEGTYLSGPPGGAKAPMPNHVLLGAIVENDAGNVFVRLTGPKALAKASKAEFRKMVESGLK